MLSGDRRTCTASEAFRRGSARRATGPSRFDCSGLTLYSFKKAGKKLPRTAQQQYNKTRHISRSQRKRGDLVFFHAGRSVYHVGIYAGDGKFIHAANAHKGVRMDNLNDSYYQAHYAGARRVLPEQMREAASIR